MREFERYHPTVNFIFFCEVIGLSMFLMHPICLCVSFVCAFLYSFALKGRRAAAFSVGAIIPLMLAAIVINPLFSHQGVTILTYLPDGNPLTWESVIYGIASAVMLGAVVCWFSCYNEVMSSDKFLYLFGKAAPTLSMIISMTLRFVPRFRERYKQMVDAQKCMGRRGTDRKIKYRIKNGIEILSAMITWMLESSVSVSESMKSRGYGVKKRTSFSLFSFTSRDFRMLALEIILGVYVIFGMSVGWVHCTYYPQIIFAEASIGSVSVFGAHMMLCVLPLLIELLEVVRWNTLKSKV